MDSTSETDHCHSTERLPPDDGDLPAQLACVRNQSERIRLYVLAALTVVLIGLCGLLAIPFLPAITWGVALAIIAWPIHRWIGQRIEQRAFASVLSCLAVVMVILVPAGFVSYQLAREAGALADHIDKDAGKSSLDTVFSLDERRGRQS